MRNIMFEQSDHAVPALNSRQVLAAGLTTECKHSRRGTALSRKLTKNSERPQTVAGVTLKLQLTPSAMLRRLYNWTLEKAAHHHAPRWLFGISFAESSFFPIPPDVLLGPMCLAKPKRAFYYAFICTLARSEEHTSELQLLMRISYAVSCV